MSSSICHMITQQDYDVDLEALCGGELSCSTCHVYCDLNIAHVLPNITVEERDLLDMIPETALKET